MFRSAKHVYAQAIDDTTGRVLAAASDTEATLKPASPASRRRSARARSARPSARSSWPLKVTAVVFDRNGFIFHGRVKEVADGAREAGLQF